MTAAILAGRQASWAERAATTALFLALGASVGAWAAAIPALKAEIGLDAAEMGVVLLAIALGSFASTVGFGLVAHRFDSGAASGLSAAAMVLGFGLPGLAATYPQLLLCCGTLGLAAGVLEVAVNAHAGDIERRWGSAIMSSFHAAFSVGGLVGALLGSLATQAGFAGRGQLWLPLVAAVLSVVLAMPWLGRGVRAQGRARVVGPGALGPAILLLGVVAALSYFLEGAIVDWSALYMASVLDAPPWLAASGFAAFSVTMAVGRLTGDAVVNRLGPRRTLGIGAVIAAAGIGLAVLASSPLVAAVGFAMVGIGAANGVPITFSAAARVARTPGAGIAAVSSFGFAGFLGGPPLIGALATLIGLRAALGVLAAAALIVALVARRAVGGVRPPAGEA